MLPFQVACASYIDNKCNKYIKALRDEGKHVGGLITNLFRCDFLEFHLNCRSIF